MHQADIDEGKKEGRRPTSELNSYGSAGSCVQKGVEIEILKRAADLSRPTTGFAARALDYVTAAQRD